MTTSLQRTSLGELGYTPLVATSLGELGSTTIPVPIVPGGGIGDIGDATLRLSGLKRRTRRNIKNLLLISGIFVTIQEADREYRRKDDETDPAD